MTNEFGYNIRSEVVSADMGANDYSYAYDSIGNRLTATNNGTGWNYLSNPLNQYTNIADGVIVEPSYDLDGNMNAAGDGWWYFWNGENRMIMASNAEHVVTYAYDHQGRMVAKTVNDVARQYLWDGYNIVQALTHSPTLTLTNSFIWGLDLSGTLQGAGGIGGLLAEIQDGEPYLASFDANGNVTEYVSTNGITVAHYVYSPFGEIVAQSGDIADSFAHRFSTKPWCGVTGLSEYEMRKYGPGMGRWLSRDPTGEQSTHNRYALLLNDATDLVDFLGLWKFVPRGNNWTPERQEYFSERLAEVQEAVDRMLQRIDALINKAESISDDCWFKEPVVRNLKNWKRMCLQDISAGLKSDKLELPVRLGEIDENVGARAYFWVKWLLGNGIYNFRYIELNSIQYFDDKEQARIDLFHEISHISGTHDEVNGTAIPANALWNAHVIADWINNPVDFVPSRYFNELTISGPKDCGCTMKDKRWYYAY